MHANEAPIEAPCHEDWERMELEDAGRRRWCEHCQERVHDLSAMDEAAARAFLHATAEREVCIAYTLDAEGEILFARGPRRSRPAPAPAAIVPLARVRRRPGVEAAKLASAASVAAVLSACTPHGKPDSVEVVSDPVVEEVQPMVVIPSEGDPERVAPPSEPPHLAPPPEEPCEPEVTPERVIKKGKRKLKGKRAAPRLDPFADI